VRIVRTDTPISVAPGYFNPMNRQKKSPAGERDQGWRKTPGTVLGFSVEDGKPERR
jgi:hypothetical protein